MKRRLTTFAGRLGPQAESALTPAHDSAAGYITARKPHECRACGETIAAGNLCIRRSGFDTFGPWTIHMHPECEPLTRDWDPTDWETYSPGEVKRPGKEKL